MEVLRPIRYWTLWMSKQHAVTPHDVIIVYNDLFEHMKGVIHVLAIKEIHSMEDLYFALMVAWHKLTKWYAEVTPRTDLLVIWAHFLDTFRKLQSFRKWKTVMDNNPEDEKSYITQYQEPILQYVENEYCTKYRQMTVIKPENIQHRNLFPSAKASAFGQLSGDPCDSSSNVEEYLMPKRVAETTPRWSDCAARWLAAARLDLNSLSESPKNWGQVNPNVNG